MLKRTVLIVCGAFALLACEAQDHFTPGKPRPNSGSEIENLMWFADVMRTNRKDLDGPLSDPALTSVTAEFGPSVIKATPSTYHSPMAVASIQPWSSWWFPKRDGYLFQDESGEATSPLSKYDVIRQRRFGNVGSAAEFERRSFNPRAVAWEGLCNAWALASILHREPRRPLVVPDDPDRWSRTDIPFSVGDLKALLLKTYEGVDDSQIRVHGQKFLGDANAWIHPDLFPDQFHRFVEVQLFERAMPFIIDHDPGVEIWNVPVYKANYTVDGIPGQPNSVMVRMWIFSAEPTRENEKDFVGTKEIVREYNYVLEGARNPAGDLVVSSGYWIKGPSGVDSRRNHPDYIIHIPDPGAVIRHSLNPEIDVNFLDEILQHSF